ncbi:hypothetical protein [Cupriavidus pauculus]|uniref:hypothetical protein n=1 Tax=Cupriavidus pauculus TaxID=82633 RepID=UPI001EE2DCF0|nr:hypothetical protein [Cupriavidus pauculus]GJG97881.1 hypothetical protein CBA19C6_25350 [Cupriavidus pauculus]
MSGFKTMPKAFAMGVALIVAACSNEEPASPAPPPRHEARSELEISAGLVPLLDEAILRNVADFCGQHAPRTRTKVETAWRQWQANNAAHLKTARYYHARLENTAANGATEDARRADQELLTQNAMLVESFTNQQVDVMRVALEHGEPDVVTQLCTENFTKVAAGEWDIRHRDPEIAAFLDKGIPKHVAPTDR